MKLKTLSLVTIAFGLLVSSHAASPTHSTQGVDSTALGIRKVPLQDEKDLKLKDYQYPTSQPGESPTIERSYENAPPLIPHSIEGMTNITQDNNACLQCHAPSIAKSVGATSVPKSHTIDFRHGDKAIKSSWNNSGVSNARYNCTQCHVPQVNAKPLEKNNFKPDFTNEKLKKSSDLMQVINEGVKK